MASAKQEPRQWLCWAGSAAALMQTPQKARICSWPAPMLRRGRALLGLPPQPTSLPLTGAADATEARGHSPNCVRVGVGGGESSWEGGRERERGRREEALTGDSMSAERAAGPGPGLRQPWRQRGLLDSQILPRLRAAKSGAQPRRLTSTTELPCSRISLQPSACPLPPPRFPSHPAAHMLPPTPKHLLFPPPAIDVLRIFTLGNIISSVTQCSAGSCPPGLVPLCDSEIMMNCSTSLLISVCNPYYIRSKNIHHCCPFAEQQLHLNSLKLPPPGRSRCDGQHLFVCLTCSQITLKFINTF